MCGAVALAFVRQHLITKLARSTSQRYFVLQSLHKALPNATLYYKACTKSFPVLLCTTKLAQSTYQYYFALQILHNVLPNTTLYYKARTLRPALCTTKLARSTSQCYFVLQSLHKARPRTTLYYKACTKHVPVLLCTTKLAQSTSLYYFVLQNYKACTKHFPVLLCTRKLACNTSSQNTSSFDTHQAFPHSKLLLHKERVNTQQAFTEKSFYTKKAFTHRKLLHTESSTHSKCLNIEAFGAHNDSTNCSSKTGSRRKKRIKGPDNPTSQLLPILSFKGCRGDGEGRKDKGGGERQKSYAYTYVCMYVRTYVCMYVCLCMCVTKLRVKDGVCESDVSTRQCRHFFASAAMSSARHAAALRTWNGLNEVFHELLCSMWCNEMCYVTTTPFLQPRIRR